MKYTFEIARQEEIDLDFQKVYDYVKNEYEADGNQIKENED